MSSRLDLGGTWKRLIGGQAVDFVPVPGSYAPVGECVLETAFECGWPAQGGRCFLCTEGVLASAEFTLNGRKIGRAGPFVPYAFELPQGLLQRHNTLQACVRDIVELFGGTPGRRFDGGLIRELCLERRAKCFIEHAAFRYELAKDFSAAHCTVMVELNGPPEGAVECTLAERETGRVVARASATAPSPCPLPKGEERTALRFTVEWPRLWSPQRPSLYVLKVRLGGSEVEESEELVGFKRLEVGERDIYLNGQRLILKGVCRHDFSEAQGYSMPPAEVRRELARIRHAGFNYVRLVHSPHARCVPRLAAELGLLVSEEPGACFHDLGDEAVAGPVLEILRRMVLRDRNCPSILAWFLYNECNPNSNYAERGARICRGLDPGCLVSFADCSGQKDNIKAMVRTAQLSFYGINIYSMNGDTYVERMKHFTDKPMLLTEWGGGWAQNNPHALQMLCETFTRQTRAGAEPRVCGCTFWVWSDYEERSRGDMCSPEGYTIEGLVDVNGKPKPDLQFLSEMCFEMDNPRPPALPRVEVLTLGRARAESWRPVPLGSIAGEQTALEQQIAKERDRHGWGFHTDFRDNMPRFGRLMIAGIEFECRDLREPRHPLLLGPGRDEIIIPVDRDVRRVAVLGHVAFTGGYPTNTVSSVHHGKGAGCKGYGVPASEYEFLFDGETVAQPLLHGVHILRANTICRWWKPAPRSPETVPAVQAVLHPAFEILRFDLWEHEFARAGRLKSIRWRLKDADAIQGMMALSVGVGS